MTFERLRKLRDHQRLWPPLHKLAAAWVGYKPPAKEGPPITYAEAAAPTDTWFKDPARFFA